MTRVTLNAVANHAGATVEYLAGNAVPLTDADTSSPNTFEVDLSDGDNVVKVKVTAEDGTTMKTYTVTVDRMASTDATLKTLSLSQGVLTPTFTSAPHDLYYTASVNDVSRITVTPMTNHAGATVEYLAGNDMTLSDADTSSADTFEVALSDGDNVVKVRVTAENGTTTKTYTLTVTRIPAAADATLESLEVRAATDVVPLTPAFTPDQVTYRAEVARSVPQVTLNAVPRHMAAGDPVFLDGNDMTLTDADTTSQNTFEVDLTEGANTIKVRVTAENGITTKDYTLTVTRVPRPAAAPPPAAMKSLEVTATDVVPLTPGFSPSTQTYTVTVPRTVSIVTLTATPDPGSTVAYFDGSDAPLADADPGTTGGQVPLAAGEKVIQLRVSAPGRRERFYRVTVTREVQPPGVPIGLRDQSGDGRVTLTWEAPPDDGGSAILRYEYRYAEGATVPEGTVWTGTGAALTATVTALANGQSYTFAVRAVNSVGSGEAARVTAMAGNNEVTAAWLSRFGRTVATHVTDAVGERLRAPATQESHVTFGGYRLPLGKRAAGETGTTAETPPGPANRLAALVTELLGLGLGRIGPGDGGTGTDPWVNPSAPDPRLGASRILRLPDVRLRDVLLGSSFRLALGATDDAAPDATRLTAWGRLAGTQFSGRERTLGVGGDVLMGTLGVDRAWNWGLAGLALAHSRGSGSFSSTGNLGSLNQSLTSLHPYLHYAVTDRLDVWGVAGYGWGEMTMESATGVSVATDTDFMMGAFGGRGVLLAAADNAGFEVSTRTDAMFMRMTADATRGGNPKRRTRTGCG